MSARTLFQRCIDVAPIIPIGGGVGLVAAAMAHVPVPGIVAVTFIGACVALLVGLAVDLAIGRD